MNNTTVMAHTIPEPKVLWDWYVFGRDVSDKTYHSLMWVEMTLPVPLWRRLLTRVLLGSLWIKRQ